MTNRSNAEPFVSIIIPVYNNPKGLRDCLDALQKQTYPSSRFEIVVADNGSDDDIAPLVSSFPNAILCRESRPGSYAARNTAVKSANGLILAFTDSDCIPEPNWIAAGVDALATRPMVDLIGDEIEVFVRDPGRPNPIETHQLVKGFYQERAVREEGRSTTANLFTYREVFDKVGPFRDDLQSGGDGDWCHRARDAGYAIEVAAAPLVLHAARYDFVAFLHPYFQKSFYLSLAM